MKHKLLSIWLIILTFILSLLGVSGCILRMFSCAYGGPEYDYENNVEVPVDEVTQEELESLEKMGD